MSRLYGRVWALEVAGRRYEGQTLHFTANYPGKGGAAQADVQAFMPARELVAALYDRTTVCRVLAGYRDTDAVEVFLGTPIKGSVTDRLADRDPSVSWQLAAYTVRSPLVRTWSGVVRASEVIDALRRHLGLAADSITLPVDHVFARGHLVERSPVDELADVARTCGATYSIEGGRLRIYPVDGAAPRLVDTWAPSSGLLDVVGPDGDGQVKAVALLRPGLRPGDRIQIRSRIWSGQVRVQAVKHEGQTDSERWATSIAGVPG